MELFEDRKRNQYLLFEDLSKEAKIILCIMINAPLEMCGSFISKKSEKIFNLHKFRKVLNREFGWSYATLRLALNELREFTKRYISL